MDGIKVYWSEAKSLQLRVVRGIGFENLILNGQMLIIRKHPTRPLQRIILIHYLNYVWVVPCVPHDDGFFLKTLYRSRKATRLFREGRLNEEN